MTFTNAQSFKEVVGILIGYINLIIPLLVALAVLLILYSGFRYVLKAADSHAKGGERDAMLWGLIALFIIMSVWGILRIMCNSVFGSPSCNNSFSSTSVPGGGSRGGPIQIVPHL